MPPPPLMTPARRAILAAGLPLVLILVTLAGYAWVKRTVTFLASQSQVVYSVGFSVPPIRGDVRVSSSNGDVTVRAATGRRILVRAHLSSSFARPAFSHRSGPDGLALDPQCRVPAGTCSLNIGVAVPARLPVSVTDSFGVLNANGLHGTVALAENAGDLTATQLTGNVHLTDSFGTLTAYSLAGNIRLDDNSGDIQAAGVVGNTRIQESFGTISVTGLAAPDVVAINNSGDVSLTFIKVPRQVDVTDSFGNITLVLPPGPATYQVTTRNSFGSTTVTVPRSSSAPNVIRATDNSGDITIVQDHQPASAPSVRPVQRVRPAGPARSSRPGG